MEKKLFYLDSNIWLNLFKKELSYFQRIPYWKIAQNFISKVMFSQDKEIIYTGFVLRELMFIINDKKLYEDALDFLTKEHKFRFVKAIPKDYDFARKLEKESNYKISFFDCMHTAICKRLSAVLITRDNLLIKFAKRYIKVNRPEELIR